MRDCWLSKQLGLLWVSPPSSSFAWLSHQPSLVWAGGSDFYGDENFDKADHNYDEEKPADDCYACEVVLVLGLSFRLKMPQDKGKTVAEVTSFRILSDKLVSQPSILVALIRLTICFESSEKNGWFLSANQII